MARFIHLLEPPLFEGVVWSSFSDHSQDSNFSCFK